MIHRGVDEAHRRGGALQSPAQQRPVKPAGFGDRHAEAVGEALETPSLSLEQRSGIEVAAIEEQQLEQQQRPAVADVLDRRGQPGRMQDLPRQYPI